MNRSSQINEAAERVRVVIKTATSELPSEERHQLLGDFATLRNAAELWARQKDREKEGA